MKETVRPARRLRGDISPPGDKSISHRAVILNAIASGEALVENFLRAEDCLATLECVRRLGVDWRWDPSIPRRERSRAALRIKGAGRDALREAPDVLDCANSGTTMRLLAGLLAAQPFFSVLTGDESLRSRPMDRVIEPLTRMGARITGRDGDTRAPLAIRGGTLRGLFYAMPVASAQVKSALLLAGLFADGETSLEEPAPTRDHTERMLRAMGAGLHFGEGRMVRIEPLTRDLEALSLRVPGDISAAAPWLILGAVHPDAEIRIQGVCVNPTRTGVIDILRSMGADISIEEERTQAAEPVADLVVRSSRLQGAEVAGDLVPRAIDELPLVALAACFAEGETAIRDAAELRVKESDRLNTTAEGLRALGADIEELDDGLRVRGTGRLRGGEVSSHGDHRLAMLLGVAGAAAEGETRIHKKDAVAVSYPWFWDDLRVLSGSDTP